MGPRSDFSKPCQGAAEKSANATRCCCLARGSQCIGMSIKKDAARPFGLGTFFVVVVQDSNRAALTTPVGRVSNQPSATTTTAACGRNREELLGPRSDFSKPRQGAVEKSANATRCCCLARGSQTRRNVYQGRTNPILYEKGFGYVFVYRRFCGACTHVRRKTAKFHYIGVFFHGGSVVYSA